MPTGSATRQAHCDYYCLDTGHPYGHRDAMQKTNRANIKVKRMLQLFSNNGLRELTQDQHCHPVGQQHPAGTLQLKLLGRIGKSVRQGCSGRLSEDRGQAHAYSAVSTRDGDRGLELQLGA